MILPALLFLCFCAVKPAELKATVIAVAEGSDVSLSCSSATGESRGLRYKPSSSLKLNSTEFLLIKNFQKQDVGYYDCNNGTHQHIFHLDLKDGSTKERLIFFRASEGDSVFFFCKTLSAASLKAEWSWTPHASSNSIRLDQTSHHFQNRLRFRKNENDFSLEISPVKWNDSGKYSCNINSASKAQLSVFELVLVRVSADPPWITLGHSVLLTCELSPQSKDFHVLWMNAETRETSSDPLRLKDVLNQQSWVCCVFIGSVLRAVFPLTLNITHAFTTTPPSHTPPSHTPPSHTRAEPDTPTTHTSAAADNYTSNPDAEHGQSHTITTTIIIGVFITFILIVVFIAVFCTKTPEKRTESVIYTEVRFRKKSDASTEHQLNSTDVPAEEESEVLYATVHLS